MKTLKLFSFTCLQIALFGAFAISSISCSARSERWRMDAVRETSDDQPYLTKEFTLNGAGNLRVETSGGNIGVVGGSGNQVKVEMYARMNNWRGGSGDAASIKEELEKYDITIKQEGNTVIAMAKRKSSFWNQNSKLSISFTVHTPTNVSSKLETSGGNISLSGLTATQEAETSGGNITTEDLKGNLDLHTSGGNISSRNISGDVKLETSGGNIRMTKCDGKWDAHTSGGNINVDEARGEMKLVTSGGGIDLREMRGSLEARTSGGSIDADIVELGQYLTLRTSGGSIEATIPGGKGLDLDLEGDRVKTALTNFNGTSEKDRVVGTVNGGGIPVKMSTSGSSVVLNYR